MEKDPQSQRPLLERVDTESSAGSSQTPVELPKRRRRSPLSVQLGCWLAQLLLFFASITTLLVAYHVSYAAASSERCLEKLSSPSPALEAISDDYEWRRFNGTIGRPSPFMGRPTDSRVQAWQDLERSKSFSIDHDTLMEIGAPKSSVQLPEEEGGGYMALLEVYHHIHCVEVLWKNTWPDFYHSDAGNEDTLFRQHLDHCADIVRQKLMCDSDVSVLTFNWVKGISHPTPNFNVLHKCRNFDDVRAWSVENQVVTDRDGQYPKPADAIELEGLP